MKKKELREEVVAAGFENVLNSTGGEARINRWIEQAIREICDYKPWPFLFDSKEGAMPLEIADLGHVIGVLDITHSNRLESASLNQIYTADPKLTAAGQAEAWYTEDNKTIKVYPSSSAAFKVYYRKTPAALTDEEEPIIPAGYHELIVERVKVYAYKFTDNLKAAAETSTDYQGSLNAMAHALLHPNYDQERRLTRAGRAEDYL